jgi:hypothetical protein
MSKKDECFVHFVFFCDQSKPGDQLELMGSWLGWDQCKALKMDGSQYPMWSCLAQVPRGNHEFKLLLVRATSEVEWENRNNRHLKVDVRCSVKGIFGNANDCSNAETLIGNSNDCSDETVARKTKKCVRCGDVVTPYYVCPICWGPVLSSMKPNTTPKSEDDGRRSAMTLK